MEELMSEAEAIATHDDSDPVIHARRVAETRFSLASTRQVFLDTYAELLSSGAGK